MKKHYFLFLTILFFSLTIFAQPANDDCTSAQNVIPDGTCVSGTTVGAFDNWTGSVGCQTGNANNHEEVWYSFTATGTQLSIDATATGSWAGDIEIILAEGNCAGVLTILGTNCGVSPQQLLYNGLTVGATYFFTISNADGGTQGTFDVCPETTNPPASCVDNDLCTNPEVLALSTGVQSCLNDCNTGALPGTFFGTGDPCYDFLFPTVWYEFTATSSDASIDVDLTSLDLTNPHYAIFTSTDCLTYTLFDCVQGAAGAASGNTILTPGQTYLIAISDVNGDEGNFQLCLTLNQDNSACNTTNDLSVTSTSMGSAFTGPFEPGEVVTFCYTITDWQQVNCNYLLGIVPTFGDGWDPSSFTAQGEPTITTALTNAAIVGDIVGGITPCEFAPSGTWSWYPAGSVDYNISSTNPMGYVAGDDVGAGWFFVTNYDSWEIQNNGIWVCPNTHLDPDDNFGDGSLLCNENTYDWSVCFQLQVKDGTACPAGEIDCSVSIKTFGDGEIGVWNSVGCTADMPTVFNASINCCPVISNPGNQTACDSYILPAISGTLLTGNESYYTGANATGNSYVPGDVISSSISPMYIYDAFGACIDQETFDITINNTPIADAPINVTACDSYSLPALSVGEYFSGSGGVGPIPAGTTITSTQTIFVYAQTGTTPNCEDENSFTITINTTPVADAPSDVTACDSYTLPALSVGGYFSGSGGVGPIPAGTTISSTQTIFVYAQTGTTPNCTDENSFTITINTTPVADAPSDVTACDSYTLPALSVGGYFSGSGGVGPIPAGTTISSTQTIFVYAQTGTTPNCTDENSFTVTINNTPTNPTAGLDATYCDGDAIADLFAAGSGGTLTWYDDAGLTNSIGSGNSLSPNNSIGTNTYYVSETFSGCESSASTVTITINPLPIINSENSTDVTACGITDGTITIVASGGSGSYLFSIDGGATFTNTTGIFTGLDVNSYQVVINDGNCQVSGNLLTIAGPGIPPAPTAGTSSTYCDGDPISDLTANADASGDNNNLTWFSDAGLTTVLQSGGGTFTPSSNIGATTYYVTETVANCQSPSSQVTVTINPTPLSPVLSGGNTYCDGDPISDLQAVAGGTSSGIFYWFNDPTLTNNVGTGPVFSPLSTLGTQTYYVIDSLNGCAGPVSSVSLTINPTPTFSTSSVNPSTCGGNDGQLILSGLAANTAYDLVITIDGTPTGNVSYTSDNSGVITVSGLSAGSYSSITTSLNGCISIDFGPYSLTDPTAPSYSVSSLNPTTCLGTDGQLLISGLTANTTYLVDLSDDGVPTGSISYTSDVNGDILINGLNAGVYNSIVVSINNCSTLDAGNYNLTDPPLPTFSINSSNPTTCGGADGQLVISGLNPNTTYSIDITTDGIPSGNTSYSSDNSGSILLNGLTAGVYSAITVTLNGCSTIDNGPYGLVDPNSPTPVIVTTIPPSGCGTFDAEIVIGNLNPNTTYTIDYSLNGSAVGPSLITTDGSGEFLISSLDEGVYASFSVILNGCVGNDAGSYSLFPTVPTVLAPTGDSTYCEGESIVLPNANPNFTGTINWYSDSLLTSLIGTGSALNTIDTTAGLYSYYVTETLNGCVSEDTLVTIEIIPQPFVVASADSSICNGDSIVIQVDSISGGSQVFWSNGDTTLMAVVNPSINTTYTVVVDDGLGCSATDSTFITVNENDDASFILTDFCAGNANAASNVVTGGGYFIFNPTVSDGALLDSSTAEITNGVGGTSYSINHITTGICPDTALQSVTVNLVPGTPFALQDTSYCDGDSIALLIVNGSNGNFSWYDNPNLATAIDTGFSLLPSNTIGTQVYYVNETIGNCTSDPDSVSVTIFAKPIADFSANPSFGIIPLTVNFTDNSSGNNLIYNWDFAGLSTSTAQNPDYIFSTIGEFTVILYITDDNGCADQTSLSITTDGVSVFVVPNVFTPNGDGVNDELNINYENIESFEGYIANRWGEIVYRWTSLDAGWTGRTNAGVNSPTGTYYYVIQAIGADGVKHNQQGYFKLIR